MYYTVFLIVVVGWIGGDRVRQGGCSVLGSGWHRHRKHQIGPNRLRRQGRGGRRHRNAGKGKRCGLIITCLAYLALLKSFTVLISFWCLFTGDVDIRASLPQFLLQSDAFGSSGDVVHVGRRPVSSRVQNRGQRRIRQILPRAEDWRWGWLKRLGSLDHQAAGILADPQHRAQKRDIGDVGNGKKRNLRFF